MKTIQIEDELYEKLEELAIPFEEATPNLVLKRMIHHYLNCAKRNDFPGDKPRRRFVNRKYGKLHRSHYRIPIIQALQHHSGTAPFFVVMEFVFSKIKERLNEIDHTKTSTGILRWQNTMRCERQVMLREGILKTGSPRGIWELNPDFDLSTLKPEGDDSK